MHAFGIQPMVPQRSGATRCGPIKDNDERIQIFNDKKRALHFFVENQFVERQLVESALVETGSPGRSWKGEAIQLSGNLMTRICVFGN